MRDSLARPEEVLGLLSSSARLPLAGLPERFGIYALRDHTGSIRYIGSTPKLTEGFRTRIFSKHTTGSEGRSHKFSQAYCTGRMWRFSGRIHPKAAAALERGEDAVEAKRLRTEFIRTYCSATIFEVPPEDSDPSVYRERLLALERQVQHLAKPEMRDWEGILFPCESEPADLVDSLLKSRGLNIDRLLRQQRIHRLLPSLQRAV